MLKKMILPIMALMIFVPQLTLAHSTLEQATPAKGATVTEDVMDITLTFNTKVEKGSSLLLKKDGQAIALTSVTINNDQLTAELGQALKSGDYNVSWEIIGADGHPVNGEYSFTVKNDTDSQTDQDAATKEKNSSNQNDTEKEQQTETDTNNKTADTSAENDSAQEGISNSLIAVIAALIVVALISFGWMIKRGKQ